MTLKLDGKNAKVYLVGAGPGNKNLITLAGLERIRRADVIVYDNLAGRELLELRKPAARLVCVGKIPGRPAPAQEEINALLIRQARAGGEVVRLKGGDAFLFGRGAEEAEALRRAGIDFEIVPGVSSAFAAPAYAGIPLTHRGLSSQVTFVTGHEDPRKKEKSVDWAGAAKTRGTLVILMGMARLEEIIRELLKAGMDKSTAAAIVQEGTLPNQRTVTGTLANIVREAKKNSVTHPAVIIIGAVVNLRKEINWYESGPLFGKKILITRPVPGAGEFREKLAQRGAEGVIFPLLEIVPEKAVSPEGFARKCARCDWIVFLSRNAVTVCFALLAKAGKDARGLGRAKIAAIGGETEKTLRGYGLYADLVPRRFTSEGLCRAFQGKSLKKKRVFIPHSRQGRKLVCEALAGRGAVVEEMFVYRLRRPRGSGAEKLRRVLREKQIDIITFTSSSCAREFMNMGVLDSREASRCVFAAIGPVTKKTLEDYGIKPEITAGEYTIDGLCAAMEEFYAQGK